jgi:CubicO group peptidase (beta-lactamase class C family)
MKKLLGSIILLLMAAGCLKEGEVKLPYSGFQPVDIGDGWILSTPEAEGMDSLQLSNVYQEVYADDATWMMKSLLVFRYGKLVAESYFKNEDDRTSRAAIWSCTKQVNAIITGIAVHQGYITSVEDSIGKYLPDYIDRYPDKKGIRIKHLLTMTGGVAFDNSEQSDIFREHNTENSIDYVLGLNLDHPPGTYFHYNDGEPQLISGIMQYATGKNLDEFGKEFLFDPLGITNYEWYRYSDGLTLGPWGILTTPRELAKVGQCVLDGGVHNQQQIIPPAWIAEMLSPHIEHAHQDAAFGYFWWSIPTKGWYYMWGHGGQFVFLHPVKHLMVVVTSLTQVDDDVALQYEQIVAIADKVAATCD